MDFRHLTHYRAAPRQRPCSRPRVSADRCPDSSTTDAACTDSAVRMLLSVFALWRARHNGEESLGCFNINSGSTTYISGWWWRGDLTVKAYNSYNCQNSYSWGTHVAVPYSQSGDWTYVTGY